jgi:hypothetical protein
MRAAPDQRFGAGAAIVYYVFKRYLRHPSSGIAQLSILSLSVPEYNKRGVNFDSDSAYTRLA